MSAESQNDSCTKEKSEIDKTRCLELSSLDLSVRSHFESASRDARPRAVWSEEHLQLRRGEGEADELVAEVDWRQVTGIWVTLESKADKNYEVKLRLKVSLETSDPTCALNFAHLTTSMDALGGAFLHFLQDSMASRLKEGRPPRFGFSKWACPAFRQGFTAYTLRIWLGRISIVMEVLYAMCFFTQLQTILASREQKLQHALVGLLKELQSAKEDILGAFLTAESGHHLVWQAGMMLIFGAPSLLARMLWILASHSSNWVMLIMLLQHVVIVFMTFDALWRTLLAVWKTLLTFQRMFRHVDKKMKRGRSMNSEKSKGSSVGSPKGGEDTSPTSPKS
mmetsp:Transcript_62241/g.131561  ORF Transcript_62241/g.131561 Transcript_62241/m.131561 type:complete len:337 (+) Transcript_62241:96-1106(+)